MLNEKTIRDRMEGMLKAFVQRTDERFLEKAEIYREVLEMSRDEFEEIYNQINKDNIK